MDHGRRAVAAQTLCKIGLAMKQGTPEAAIKTTHTLETPETNIVYDVHGQLPTADGRPVLFMIGQPMDASGFQTLASHFPDRTVVTYDPRGLGRSDRKDGRVENAPNLQAHDLHALIEALGAGPVEMFASSGGAVTALALVAAYPQDVAILVAHEPPLLALLPDAKEADRAEDGVRNGVRQRSPVERPPARGLTRAGNHQQQNANAGDKDLGRPQLRHGQPRT